MKNINAIPDFKDEKYVLMFTSNHCPYCKEMEKIIKGIEKKYIEKGIEFFNINISNNLDIAEKYGIRSTPQTFFMHGKNTIGREIGAVSERAVEMQLDDLLKAGEFMKKIKGFFKKKKS